MKYVESEKQELKRELIDEIKNTIIAFLNTRGGTIYIGVNDDGSINEAFIKQNKDEIDKKLGNWIHEAFFPSPHNLINFAFNKDGVLEVRISEGKKKPYYLKEKGPKPSGVFKRVGSSTRKASDDEILMMIMSSNNYVYEEAESEEQALTFKQLTDLFEEKGIECNERLFTTLGLKNSKGIFTNLGYILSDQSPIMVKFADYDAQRNFRIKKNHTGCLIKILYDVEEQAERLNTTTVIIDGESFTRKDIKSYPGASLREIILNAFCHADYFIRSNIKIEFYDDKVKVTSPGGIYNATLEDIMKGVQTYRNPKLVHILDKLGLVENFGTGIPRTIEAYEGMEKTPVFESSDNFFYVTLPNLNYRDETGDQINDEISDQINDEISDLGLEILKAVKVKPGIKVPEILERLKGRVPDISLDRVRNEIRRNLQNYIEYEGSKKTGGYYIKEK